MRIFILFVVATVTALLWGFGDAVAQTSYPMITHTVPVAVQRGRTTEVTVEGQMDFRGVYQALFQGQGITAEIVPGSPLTKEPPKKSAKASTCVQ